MSKALKNSTGAFYAFFKLYSPPSIPLNPLPASWGWGG